MAFIDEMKIYAEAGRGGDGVVRWRQEKFIPKGGPAGGDGGRGGDFYIEAVRDIAILSKYKAKKEFKAEKGEDGGGKSLHGKKGNDFILKVPIGTIITKIDNLGSSNLKQQWQLLDENQKILLLKGGYGGFGNEHFKKSTNTTPKESNQGQAGEKGEFLIELELFADFGLIGLPNAGKSSLLNILTNAKAKIGDYPFTTLDPNLGYFYGYVLADIPGLIEGASTGKGLGTKFLKHIKRTKILAHLISFENLNTSTAGMKKAYKEIRKELEIYDQKNNLGSEGLSKKEEIVILTKADILIDKKITEKTLKDFKKINKNTFVLSLYDDISVKNLADNLIKILKK